MPAELRVSVPEPPPHGVRRWLMFAAACVVLSGFGPFSAGPAGAAPLSDCTPHRGTVVAVDFAHWGGPIVRGCGIEQPSGYALLRAAGFTTAGDAHDGDAFICRIGDQAFDDGVVHPTPSQDPCIATPSTSAYWSYWLAPAGQNTWTYSPIGPMGDKPRPGEVELWMFGATNVGGTRGSGVPRFPPSKLRAANAAPTTHTTPTPTTPSTTAHTTATTTATRAASAPVKRVRTAHRSTAKRRTATRHRQPRRPTRRSSGAPSPPRRVAAGFAPVVSAQPTDERTSSGSAGPLVIGLCLALVLATGAVWTVWRRRRYE